MRRVALTALCCLTTLMVSSLPVSAGHRHRAIVTGCPLVAPYPVGDPYCASLPICHGAPRGFGFSLRIGRLNLSVGHPGSFTYYRGPVGGPPVWGPRDPGYHYLPAPQPMYPAAPLPNVPLENRWDDPPPAVEPLGQPSPLAVQNPSSPLAKERSLRAQGDGDMWFRRQEYHRAYERYKAAISAAPDRPEPYFRLALTFAALGYFDQAVREIKRGVQVDSAWVTTGADLTMLFGRDGSIPKSTVIQRVTAWARDDLRDPDRLFLLGVLLHFDGDERRARPLLEAADKFSGGGDHVAVFLEPAEIVPQEQAAPPAAIPEPPAAAEPIPPPKLVAPNAEPSEPTQSGPMLPPLPMP